MSGVDEIPQEVRQVEGCNCGGREWHKTTCTIFELPHDVAMAAKADADERVRQYCVDLSNRTDAEKSVDVLIRASKLINHANERHDYLMYSILAGLPMTVVGKPVTVSFQWPDGLPDGMTEDDVREWAREGLEQLKVIAGDRRG